MCSKFTQDASCFSARSNPRRYEASAEAMAAIFPLISSHTQEVMLGAWLDAGSNKKTELVSKGRLTTIAYLHAKLSNNIALQRRATIFLKAVVTGPDKIETRTTAMECLYMHLQRRIETLQNVLGLLNG